jgi:hypothetical protein
MKRMKDMEKQTESYIILKPIAERFNRVAGEISDNDIKSIIKMAMVEQIKVAFNFNVIGTIVDSYIEEHEEDIKNMVSESIGNRMKMPDRY